jgi:hypothetical protein
MQQPRPAVAPVGLKAITSDLLPRVLELPPEVFAGQIGAKVVSVLPPLVEAGGLDRDDEKGWWTWRRGRKTVPGRKKGVGDRRSEACVRVRRGEGGSEKDMKEGRCGGVCGRERRGVVNWSKAAVGGREVEYVGGRRRRSGFNEGNGGKCGARRSGRCWRCGAR